MTRIASIFIIAIIQYIIANSYSKSIKSFIPKKDWYNSTLNQEDESYLFHGKHAVTNDGTRLMKDLVKLIHSHQNPPKKDCLKKRFLVMHMKVLGYEGIGSVLKQIIVGLAIAMQSNRVLVFGGAFPYLFEYTDDVWGGHDKRRFQNDIHINDKILDCSTGSDSNSAAYDCFFQQLSTCSLLDATVKEIEYFSVNGYDEQNRILLSDMTQTARKAIALYQPPMGLFQKVFKVTNYSEEFIISIQDYLPHYWFSAITSYVFRIKSDLIKQFDTMNEKLVNSHASDNSGASATSHNGDDDLANDKNQISIGLDNPAHSRWGLHIRHGDVVKMRAKYNTKKVFDFVDYFKAARDLSNIQKFTPKYLYIATDSIRFPEINSIYEAFNQPSDISSEVATEKLMVRSSFEGCDGIVTAEPYNITDIYHHVRSQYSTWFNNSVHPQLILDETRYRTELGHKAAAGPACLRHDKDSTNWICSLTYEEALLHHDDNKLSNKGERLMRVMLEAIEDIYLLSLSDSIIGLGYSHFGTIAVPLMWARTGLSEPLVRSQYLDIDSIMLGTTPSAYLHEIHVKERKELGIARWEVYNTQFISGLDEQHDLAVGPSSKLEFDPWEKANHLKIKRCLPFLKPDLAYREFEMWNQKTYTPLWPGSCPRKNDVDNFSMLTVSNLIKLASIHHEQQHGSQSFLCEQLAEDITVKYSGDPKAISDVRSNKKLFSMFSYIYGKMVNGTKVNYFPIEHDYADDLYMQDGEMNAKMKSRTGNKTPQEKSKKKVKKGVKRSIDEL